MKIFIGIVKEKATGQVVHEHVAQYSDDSFHCEIYGETGYVVNQEFRKFHHLISFLKEKHPEYECDSFSDEVDAVKLIEFLSKQ